MNHMNPDEPMQDTNEYANELMTMNPPLDINQAIKTVATLEAALADGQQHAGAADQHVRAIAATHTFPPHTSPPLLPPPPSPHLTRTLFIRGDGIPHAGVLLSLSLPPSLSLSAAPPPHREHGI